MFGNCLDMLLSLAYRMQMNEQQLNSAVVFMLNLLMSFTML